MLQPGTRQVAAGYVVYGSSTMLVYTTGHGVHGFTLDPAIGAFSLSHERIVMPAHGTIYSVNEANADSFPAGVPPRTWLHLRRGEAGRTYSSRYIGSLVADFHRTLLKGGVFLYPPTRTLPGGKLRLLYEAQPDRLPRRAGRRRWPPTATSASSKSPPPSLHQRTPLYIGSKGEVENVLRFVNRST